MPSSPPSPPTKPAAGATHPPRQDTIGYEQVPRRAPARSATIGYENAMWRWQSSGQKPPEPNETAPAASEPPTQPTPPPEVVASGAVAATMQLGAPESSAHDPTQAQALAPTSLAQEPEAAAQSPAASAIPMSTTQVVAEPGAASAAPTLDVVATRLAAAVGSSSFDTAARSRSTVLPRVELTGPEPKLVRDDRARYEHISHLGQGGVGEVLKAQDNDIGRVVAVKRLLPEMQVAPVLVRFVHEIRTIGQLEHPNIVPIHDVGVDERGEYYFVMKYVEGETLESIIAKLAAGDRAAHASYPPERRAEIFEQILEAIRYAHANGILHRDIKPANVMVGRFGEVVVMDWGIAKRLRSDAIGPDPNEILPRPSSPPMASQSTDHNPELFQTRAGLLIGTPAYMSPEQAQGKALDERSDIYSLCVVLHEFLTLRHHLADKGTLDAMLSGVIEQRAPLAGLLRHPHQGPVPMDLAWFVHKGLAKDPAERYQSVAEMIERLQRRRQGMIPIQCPITFMKRVTGEWFRFVDGYPVAGMLAAAAMVGLIATLTWFALH